MKHTAHPQSTTSLPRAPRDEVESRSVQYLVLMGVRVVCFILMVFVQPFGWWTLAFGVGAVFLPYIAVVLANVGQEGRAEEAVLPQTELEAPASDRPTTPSVVRLTETPQLRDGAHPTDRP